MPDRDDMKQQWPCYQKNQSANNRVTYSIQVDAQQANNNFNNENKLIPLQSLHRA
jgi:hypothetical protein